MSAEQPIINEDICTTYITESKRRIVLGINSPHLVLKFRKVGERLNPTEDPLAHAQLREKSDEKLRRLIQEQGSDPEIVPITQRIIYKTAAGLDIAEIQPWYKGAKHLADLELGVLKLNKEILQDLRNLLRANSTLWEEEQTTLDLAGTLKAKQSPMFKIIQQLFPIFTSYNIMVHPDEGVRFIDTDRFVNDHKRTKKIFLLQSLQAIGTKLNIAILSGIIQLHELKSQTDH